MILDTPKTPTEAAQSTIEAEFKFRIPQSNFREYAFEMEDLRDIHMTYSLNEMNKRLMS